MKGRDILSVQDAGQFIPDAQAQSRSDCRLRTCTASDVGLECSIELPTLAPHQNHRTVW